MVPCDADDLAGVEPAKPVGEPALEPATLEVEVMVLDRANVAGDEQHVARGHVGHVPVQVGDRGDSQRVRTRRRAASWPATAAAPADRAVLGHERAEVPVGEAVADEVGRRRHRRRARAPVDQGDLAEMVTGPQARALARRATETVASPDSIKKNAAPPEPSLITVSPAANRRSLNRRAICSPHRRSSSANSGTRCRPRPDPAAAACHRARPARRDGAALQQVELCRPAIAHSMSRPGP